MSNISASSNKEKKSLINIFNKVNINVMGIICAVVLLLNIVLTVNIPMIGSMLAAAALWYCWFAQTVIRNYSSMQKNISKWVLLSICVIAAFINIIRLIIIVFEEDWNDIEVTSRALYCFSFVLDIIPTLAIWYILRTVFINDRPAYVKEKKLLNMRTIAFLCIVSFLLNILNMFQIYNSFFLFFSIIRVIKILCMIFTMVFVIAVALSLNKTWKENKQFCACCGAELAPGKKFCVRCGTKI